MITRPSATGAGLFGRERALVGMVHVHALPGTPGSSESVDSILTAAASDAKAYASAGFDAVIVENMHDAPYVHGAQGPEIVAIMTLAAVAVRDAARNLPLGVQVLSGGNREALAVALACGGRFIRCENFVFSHVADEGLLDRAEAGPLLRYRRRIGAEGVAILADIKKKHASHAITADVSISEAVEAAEFFRADGVVVTGRATGKSVAPSDLAEARRATNLPVVVGSGATPEQLPALFGLADAVIVGSFVKRDGRWDRPVELSRCAAMVSAADTVRRKG